MAVWLVFLSVLCGAYYCTQTLEDRVASLDDIVRQQNVTITSLLAANEILKHSNDILKQEVAVLRENSIKDRVTRQSHSFGFTAYHDRDETLHQGQTLKFSRTIYNAGSIYNPNTGVATIPVDGTYIFSVTIEHWQTQELRCYLLVNGANMVDVVIFLQGKSTQSSNSAVLGLNAGNTVWVTCDDGNVFGNDVFHGTTFSGVYLY